MLGKSFGFGVAPGWKLRMTAGIATAALSVSVAGCATKSTPPPQAQVYQQPVKVAGYPDRLRIEDDGIVEQLPPLRPTKPVVDDPTEPFSPNYGRASSMKRSDLGTSQKRPGAGLSVAADRDLAKSATGS